MQLIPRNLNHSTVANGIYIDPRAAHHPTFIRTTAPLRELTGAC